MKRWPLHALERLRSGEARMATIAAARASARAREAETNAGNAARRAAEKRSEAGRSGPGPGPGAMGEMPSAELGQAAAGRLLSDAEARWLGEEARRAAARALDERSRAGWANDRALLARGRADALTRGAARFCATARSARAAAREREVEEAWRGARGPRDGGRPG